MYDYIQVRTEYLKKLNTKEANTFLTDKDSEKFEKELKKRAKLK